MDEGNRLPGRGDSYPSQDGVDRSEHVALIARLVFREPRPEVGDGAYAEVARLNQELPQILSQVVNDAVREVWPDAEIPRRSARRYAVGPAADGLFADYIVTLWEHKETAAAILGAGASASEMARLIRSAWRKLRVAVAAAGATATCPRVTLPPAVLETLCEDHVRRTYHPRAKLTIEWFVTTTEFYAGYQSPAHPTEDVEYLIAVRAGRKVYTYAVNGAARVTAHAVKEGRRVTPMPAPDLLLNDGLSSPSPSRFIRP
jgi:hypothetical protein